MKTDTPREQFARRLRAYVHRYYKGDLKAFARKLTNLAEPRDSRTGKRDVARAKQNDTVVRRYTKYLEEWCAGEHEPRADHLRRLCKSGQFAKRAASQ